ncbi:MAG: PKD domain-containing protein [Crocinitomicaceae bacterium]|nr:PKD domain-containing protein [Crocinitomicaceae bacterium]
MKTIIVILLFLISLPVRADHIIGGEMYYDYLGSNNYKFYISMYKDCTAGAPFDSPMILAVHSGNMLIQAVEVPYPGFTAVPITYDNPCATPPPGLCIQNAVYTIVLNLPPTAVGYDIAYQRCCRKPNITNIINPGDTGFTLTCSIPGGANNNHINSSPRFSGYPPGLLCINDELIHDQSATDPDNDELIYSLTTPYQGGSPTNVAPTPGPAPYPYVNWAGGISAANPLGPGSAISIDANTGELTASPAITGLFVIGIRVQEVRNGIIIGETVLDFLLQVFDCNIVLAASLPNQEELASFVSYCQGLTVNFENESWGTQEFYWDFGVPGTTTDTSTDTNPIFTYPTDGIYEVMIIANPSGNPCVDTAYMTIEVHEPFTASFTAPDTVCIENNSVDFDGTTDALPVSIITWDFGANVTPGTANTIDVNGVNFGTPGTFNVTLEVANGQCVETFSSDIVVLDSPEAIIVLPPEIECDGLIIDFGNSSTNATNYQWDFGDATTTSDFEPTHEYLGPGTYTATLSAWTLPICTSTTSETFVLNEKLEVEFVTDEWQCFIDNSFDFDATVAGPPTATFTWDFGPNASISSSTDIDVFDVNFNVTGYIPITLTGSFDDCEESVTHEIYIYTPPTIDFTLEPGLQCVPFNAQFINLSSSETELFYHWDFGDGNVSAEANPSNLFDEVGHYPITLTIWTTSGCIDTLTLTQQDIVNVRPSPEAAFSVDPDYTDICHSVVHFTDESVGATQWFYWYDDSTSFGMEQHPAHLYYTDGWHRPMQVAENEWGCKDTAYAELFIEPFTIYAPTMFTPDGDEFNNTFLPIVYLEVVTWNMKIYNRWGQLMFESNDVDAAWDGIMSNGRMAQVGTYTWKITYVSCEPSNDERIITGHISLDR